MHASRGVGKAAIAVWIFVFFLVAQLFFAAEERKCPSASTVTERDSELRRVMLREINMNVTMIDTEELLQSHLTGKFLQTSLILWGRIWPVARLLKREQ